LKEKQSFGIGSFCQLIGREEKYLLQLVNAAPAPQNKYKGLTPVAILSKRQIRSKCQKNQVSSSRAPSNGIVLSIGPSRETYLQNRK
jgi:hypothetical protein